jgi:hypothetical protein
MSYRRAARVTGGVPYRTVGSFVVIDTQGDKFAWHLDSPTINVTRVR